MSCQANKMLGIGNRVNWLVLTDKNGTEKLHTKTSSSNHLGRSQESQ